MKVLVLGASGFVGRYLVPALARRGDEVVTASLRDPDGAIAAAASCDAIVNLAGEPVAAKWTPELKARIRSSRVDQPRRLLEGLRGAERKPSVYVSASAIGYYGVSETASFVEDSPPGDDFLAKVCVEWERVALGARELGMRTAIVRTGVVLGDGGALAKMLPPFRLGIGGTIGSGRQWISWIHVDDIVGIFLAALDRGDGVYNGTAPEPVTNAGLSHALGRALHRPSFLPVPPFTIKMMLGEGAYLVEQGQRVLPKRTEEELRYAFAFPALETALADVLAKGA